jgi:hypothetical protein
MQNIYILSAHADGTLGCLSEEGTILVSSYHFVGETH